MIEIQLVRRGIGDRALLAAMQAVPREDFVNQGFEEFAYDDCPLPIGEGQTISQPYVVALMIQAAEIGAGDRVLEVGAGSGYAAAVISRIAERVHAIERYPSLVEAAAQRFQTLGYDNIELHVGDGTLGWPAAAPFDAIIVSAGGPEVPPALKEQLAIGGRLLLPVGSGARGQTLRKVTRTGVLDYREEDLGAVQFVPLVGAQGWSDLGRLPGVGRSDGKECGQSLPAMIAEAAEPLGPPEDEGFARAFDRFGSKRVVLLGESSHGTAEFYRARAAITRRLIQEHGFILLAVEADWPDAAAVDRRLRQRPSDGLEVRPFQRFPRWMWRNGEVETFLGWLRDHNAALPRGERTGFYGLDLYNLNGSIEAVLNYLDRVDPEAAAIARERYGCLTPWQKAPATYGRAVLTSGYRACQEPVVEQCRALLEQQLERSGEDRERRLDAGQNAKLVAAAEHYYSVLYYGGPEAWNLRDRHMFDTLEHLLERQGPEAKAVVWAHNSHVGDARFTEMGSLQAELSLGQLCRDRYGSDAALVGFGTHQGEVTAASRWGGDTETKTIRPSLPGSYERLCHDSGVPRFLLDTNEHHALRYRLLKPRLERFIGVIYRPETELDSHYIQASLPRQFDAYVWFDETSPVSPLSSRDEEGETPDERTADTYPTGL